MGQRVVVKSLRRKGKKYKKNNHKIGKIIITNLLNEKPKSSELRLELGHWEVLILLYENKEKHVF